jgi:hypothetical protein
LLQTIWAGVGAGENRPSIVFEIRRDRGLTQSWQGRKPSHESAKAHCHKRKMLGGWGARKRITNPRNMGECCQPAVKRERASTDYLNELRTDPFITTIGNKMLSLPLAYKYVALAVMVAEINFCASNLHLNQPLPISSENLKAVMIHDPRPLIGFNGRLDTENYSFSFVRSGKLRFITRLDAPGRQSLGIYRGSQSRVDCIEQLSHMKSIISSNDAYHIATNWLVAMDVDLQKLEAEKSPEVEQQFLQSPGRGLVPVPLFYVRWGEKVNPTVDIMISGVTGELLNLRQEDDSYSKRPASLIKDMDKLLAIPDEEFLKMSSLEKSNLFVRFAAVQYPAPNSSAAGQNTNGVLSP